MENKIMQENNELRETIRVQTNTIMVKSITIVVLCLAAIMIGASYWGAYGFNSSAIGAIAAFGLVAAVELFAFTWTLIQRIRQKFARTKSTAPAPQAPHSFN